MKLKQTSFTKMLFTFIALVSFTFIGAVNVNAEEVKIADSIDTIAEYMSDDTTDIVKLKNDITFSGQDLIFYIKKDKTLDLSGYSIISDNNASYGIKFWYYKDASVKIIDSSNSGTSKIKLTYNGNASCYAINNSITGNDVTTADFSIDGVDFESSSYNTYLISNGASKKLGNLSIKNSNIAGFYQIFSDGDFTSVKLTNVTKTKTSGETTYLSNSSNSTVADIIDEDSILEYYTSGTTKVVADRATKLSDIDTYWGDISIKYLDGFNVDNVNLTETYKATPTEKEVTIKNRGTSDLQVKNVTVDSGNFEIVGSTQPTISAGATDNTSFKIKAKEGLDAGTYTATITVTDVDDKTYTATVTLKVNPKQLTLGVDLPSSWVYKTTQTPTLSGIDELGTGDYVLNYYEEDDTLIGTTQPKLVGKYKAELSVTNANYSASPASADFEITPITNKVTVRSSDATFEYDGTEHSNNTYSSYYLDSASPLTDNKLPNGDKISAVITGKVKDVKDTADENNTIESIKITNSNGDDVTNCYSNIVKNTGKLTVTQKDSKIKVTTEGATRVYNGEELTNSNYNTSGTGVAGDNVVVTMTGTQTFVGSSDNTFTVKVMRGTEDVTDNYTFGTHSYGKLTVTPAEQNLSIADQYVRVNGSIATSDLIREVSGAKGNVNISIKSGTALTYNNVTNSFDAGTATGDVVMTVTASSFDDNSDSVAEWKETTKEFTIHVVEKESVSFSGIEDNQVFTYDGISSKTPVGTITVIDNKVPVSELEVYYKGTGSTTYSDTYAPGIAGTYTVTYKVKDSNPNYMGSVTYNFTIKKIQVEKVTLAKNSFEYTGSSITPTVNNTNDKLTIYGDTTARDVDNYKLYAKLNDTTNYEWKDGTTDVLTLNWSIVKATPDYTVPTGLTSVKGKTLNDVSLPDRFTWNDSTTVLTAGTHTYKATYTPEDTDNYNTITDIDIEVVVKDLFDLTTSVDGGNGTITASKNDIVEGSNVEVTFTPDTGYMIDKVLVNGAETTVTGNKLNLTMNENKEVKVSYKKIPFTVTVKDVTGATITPNGAVTVNYGDNQEFTITANNGYKLIKVLVDGTDKISDMVDGKLTLTNITSNINLEVVVEKIVYEVIEGANQKYVITENDKAVFKINADLRLFSEVYVDDVLVDSANYDLESGSTIITLKKEYVDTLSEGEHTLRAVFNDGGEATTKFTVAKVNTPIQDDTKTEDNPKTGDNIIFYVATGTLSMIGLAGAGIYTYRRKQEN